MTTGPDELEKLKRQLAFWMKRCEVLQEEVEYLRTHPTIAQGLKGERVVCALTQGTMTKYAERYDVVLPNELVVEVKFSKLNTPVHGASTRRWNWAKPLGHMDRGKHYDFLILLGEKDHRHPVPGFEEGPYVSFLIPYQQVRQLMTDGKTIGGQIMLSSNLTSGRAEKSKLLRRYMVRTSDIDELLKSVQQVLPADVPASAAEVGVSPI